MPTNLQSAAWRPSSLRTAAAADLDRRAATSSRANSPIPEFVPRIRHRSRKMPEVSPQPGGPLDGDALRPRAGPPRRPGDDPGAAGPRRRARGSPPAAGPADRPTAGPPMAPRPARAATGAPRPRPTASGSLRASNPLRCARRVSWFARCPSLTPTRTATRSDTSLRDPGAGAADLRSPRDQSREAHADRFARSPHANPLDDLAAPIIGGLGRHRLRGPPRSGRRAAVAEGTLDRPCRQNGAVGLLDGSPISPGPGRQGLLGPARPLGALFPTPCLPRPPPCPERACISTGPSPSCRTATTSRSPGSSGSGGPSPWRPGSLMPGPDAAISGPARPSTESSIRSGLVSAIRPLAAAPGSVGLIESAITAAISDTVDQVDRWQAIASHHAARPGRSRSRPDRPRSPEPWPPPSTAPSDRHRAGPAHGPNSRIGDFAPRHPLP
jgi:hypothetical protein